MLGTPQVFISHSSKGDPYAKQVLDRLHELLEARNYESLISLYDMEPAKAWEPQLNKWLLDCHFAVILLSKKALESSWVKDEATVLLTRASARGLPVYAVLLDGLQRDDVRKAGLDRLNKIEYLDIQDVREAKDVADRIATRFAPVPTPKSVGEPMWDWIDRVADALRQVRDPDRLVAAAERLGLVPADAENVRQHGGELFLAEHMMNSRLSEQALQAIDAIARSMPGEARKALIKDIVPTWVDPVAAGLILSVTPEERGIALLNACEPETGKEYFARATFRASKLNYWSKSVDGRIGFQPIDVMVTRWEKALAKDRLNDRDRRPQYWRCFIILTADGSELDAVAEAIRDMHVHYPWLGFLVLTGESLPDSSAMTLCQLRGAVPLQPELLASAEREARQRVDRLGLLARQD